MRIALKTGAYQSRSLISSAQRCINLYAEQNPPDAPCPFTYYPFPGLTLLAPSPGTGGARCNYRASDGTLYRCVGTGIYRVDAAWNHSLLGSIPAGTTPVSMADNGLALVVVDGSSSGWAVDLAAGTFGPITGDAFFGADKADYVDTYLLFNRPGTAQFYITLSNATYAMLTGGTAFDPLDIAGKTGFADALASLAVIHRELWLVGALTAEIWQNTGASDFTFQAMTGAFVEHGTVAKYSVAAQDTCVYWLGQDKQGQCIVTRGAAYLAERISTHAIEAEFATYPTVSDAVGFTLQFLGHTFYVLTFPTADRTWAYDEATKQWCELLALDADGNFHRHRIGACANAYGKVVIGDWQTGDLYALDVNAYTDNGNPVPRVRSFPHLVNDGDRVVYPQLIADMECGTDPNHEDPQVFLRWSDDRGKTYGNAVSQSLGRTGEYRTSVQFQRLGMARDRVFELSWSADCKTALNGAFVDARKCGT